MKIKRLVLGTTNPAKLKEWTEFLKGVVPVINVSEMGEIPEPKEDGESFIEVAREKALHYAKHTGEYVLSEDGGFEIDALGGLPGIKSRRILPGDREGTDKELIDYVIKKLKGVPLEKRAARLVVHVAIADPEGNIIYEDKGTIEGVIPQKPTTSFTPGYPYRAIFYIKEAGKIFAEFDAKEHEKFNHRVPIARRLAKFLLE
jgi:XTP/dITP diphosphohydrolase